MQRGLGENLVAGGHSHSRSPAQSRIRLGRSEVSALGRGTHRLRRAGDVRGRRCGAGGSVSREWIRTSPGLRPRSRMRRRARAAPPPGRSAGQQAAHTVLASKEGGKTVEEKGENESDDDGDGPAFDTFRCCSWAPIPSATLKRSAAVPARGCRHYQMLPKPSLPASSSSGATVAIPVAFQNFQAPYTTESG